jgi:hypothetical protein
MSALRRRCRSRRVPGTTAPGRVPPTADGQLVAWFRMHPVGRLYTRQRASRSEQDPAPLPPDGGCPG